MAIDTNNKKLALLEWGQPWEPGLPMSPGTLGQDDQQQLLWEYPGILWGEEEPPVLLDLGITSVRSLTPVRTVRLIEG